MKNQTENTPVPLSEMTLRDFFASQALQAIISKMPVDVSTDGILQKRVAIGAYQYADSMLELRK